jgi:ATP-binding cassette subfamily C protein
MGWTAIGGMVILIAVTLLNQRNTEASLNEAAMAGLKADRQAENLKSESELVRALGMTRAAFARWQKLRGVAQVSGLSASDTAGAFSVLTKTFRLFLQSAILGIGAWLVLEGEPVGRGDDRRVDPDGPRAATDRGGGGPVVGADPRPPGPGPA